MTSSNGLATHTAERSGVQFGSPSARDRREPRSERDSLDPALEVGEQIRRLQALAELRAAGVLTEGELADLKRRVLSSRWDAAPPARHYVTALRVVGTAPVTCRAGAHKRPTYLEWKKALKAAAVEAAAGMERTGCRSFSLWIELRLCDAKGPGSDLDNYVKPIQDALAECRVFGPPAREGSPMKGDERVDHLDVRRRRVSSEAEAGVRAEVWALDA